MIDFLDSIVSISNLNLKTLDIIIVKLLYFVTCWTIISNWTFSFDYMTSDPLSDNCIIEMLQELLTNWINLYMCILLNSKF